MSHSSDDAGMNKSERIREYILANPKAKPKEITEALSEYGVSYPLINKVLHDFRLRRKAARISAPVSSVTGAANLDVTVMDHGIRFAEACGGIDKAREILSVIERIWESRSLLNGGKSIPGERGM